MRKRINDADTPTEKLEFVSIIDLLSMRTP